MDASVGLVDRFGRVATDLRISLTDRCSLRCTYCMPAEGLAWLPRAELLSAEEIVTLAEVFLGLGVRSLRLTGGEPLLFSGLPQLVGRLSALAPRPEISLTTNGVGLVHRADALVSAGLDRINVSLDTLNAERFHQLTRRERLEDVLAGVEAARAAGLRPIKINAVLLRSSNFAEAGDLLGWALHEGYRLRFIEHMPLDAQREWDRAEMVAAEDVLARLAKDFRLEPLDVPGAHRSAPAEQFAVLDGPGRSRWNPDGFVDGRPVVGVIASVTRPFCRDCDRLRLTSDGQLRTCLFANDETDLRGPLRAGATRAELSRLIVDAVAGKQAGHTIAAPGFVPPTRPMSAIGG